NGAHEQGAKKNINAFFGKFKRGNFQ
ncbi:MAG: hypothetical protein RIQ61_874, partial [Bacteroidota bacterium]